MKECLFCGGDFVKKQRCPHCGLGKAHRPWELPAWEESGFFLAPFNWLRTFWVLVSAPRDFFRTLRPQGSLLRAWFFVFPLFVLSSFAYMAVLYKWNVLGQPSNRFSFFWSAPFDLFLMGRENVISSLGKCCWMFVQLWFVLNFGMSCVLHFALNVNNHVQTPWPMICRVLSYAFVPLFIFFLLPAGFIYMALTPEDVALSSWETIIAFLCIVLLPVNWLFSLIKIALEECLSVSRYRAGFTVLSMVLLLAIFWQLIKVSY